MAKTFYVDREIDHTYNSVYYRIYKDVDKTELVDTLSITLHGKNKDFEYSYLAEYFRPEPPEFIKKWKKKLEDRN